MTDNEVANQAEAIANLPRDLALVKIENDQIMAMAAARPRNYKRILDDLREQLESYPSFAEEAVYCKPVGKDKDGQMQFARGLSIRSAEAISEAYGYNRVSTTVDPVAEEPDNRRITATFVDYQRGRVWQESVVLSPWYKTRYGKMKRHNEDRFLNVVVKAERSKVVREAILRCVPAGLKSELTEIAERAQSRVCTEEQAERLIEAWETKGLALEDLEAVIGKTRSNWSQGDRLRMAQLWNAVESGETSLDELRQREDEPKESEAKPEGSDEQNLFGKDTPEVEREEEEEKDAKERAELMGGGKK